MRRPSLVQRRRGKPAPATRPMGRMEPGAVQAMTQDLGILAHPVRLQLLDILARNAGDVCVFDLEEALPVKQPTISHHLKLLREAGLVGSEKRGLAAYYFVHRDAVAALRQRIVAGLEIFEQA